MRVVIVSSYKNKGGAAIAAYRLFTALKNSPNIEVSYLFQKSAEEPQEHEYKIINTFFDKLQYGIRHIRNNRKLKGYQVENGVYFSVNQFGYPLENHPLIQKADVIHFHWVSDSFLAPKTLQTLADKGKTIVWTLHDMRAFTGGCSYSGTCHKFTDNCGACPALNSTQQTDITRKIWENQHRFYPSKQLNIITPSRWLAEEALKSSLLKESNVISIPNTLNQQVFRPLDKIILRNKYRTNPQAKVLAFGAVSADNDKRKGFDLLINALEILAHQPQSQPIELIIFGTESQVKLPFKTTYTQHIFDEHTLAEVYSLSDFFVIPSREENLPNTIAESLSCGTPVIGFNVGGIPELIIDNRTGYLAQELCAESLAQAITEAQSSQTDLSTTSRKFAEEKLNPQTITHQHLIFYKSLRG